MPDYVTLLGAEDVQRASRRMIEAAERMERAASQIDESLQRHAERIETALAAPQPEHGQPDSGESSDG